MADESTIITEVKQEPATPVIPESKQNLSAIIAAAQTELSKPAAGEIVKPAETKVEETKVEPAKPTADELTGDDLVAARNLFRALKNPETAKTTIKLLADSIGLTGQETKIEKQVVVKTMLELFKEQLGPDLEFMAEKLLPVMEKMVDAKLEPSLKPFRDNIEQTEQAQLVSEADKTISDLSTKFFGTGTLPADFESDMSALMDKISPSKSMGAKEYVENIFYMVAGRRGVTPTSKTISERVAKAVNNAPANLTSTSGIAANEIPNSNKKMSLNESIAAAQASLLGKSN